MKSFFTAKNVDIFFFTSIVILTSFWVYRKSLEYSLTKKDQKLVFIIISCRPKNQLPENGDLNQKIQKSSSYLLNVAVLYASQSGSAIKLSHRLRRFLLNFEYISVELFDMQNFSVKKLDEFRQIKNYLVLFVVSTYGEGDPPNSSRKFYEDLQVSSLNLKDLNFMVFGLGNSIYPKFNTFAKFIDKQLVKLGANKLMAVRLGDANKNIEHDFLLWCSEVREMLLKNYNLTSKQDVFVFETKYDVKMLNENTVEKVFTGEISNYKSYIDQRPPFDEINPFMASIIKKKVISKLTDHVVLHLEFDIFGSKLKYEPGDYVGIYPQNDSSRVKLLAEHLNFNLDQIIDIKHFYPSFSGDKAHFPTPCSIRTALMHYLDIQQINDPEIFSALAHYTSDNNEKKFLSSLSHDNILCMKKRNEFIVNQRKDILEVLQEFSTCRPPIEILVQVLPRLAYRHYSISSRPDNNPLPSTLHVTVAVVEYENSLKRTVKGVCSSWLLRIRPGSQVPIFITRSQFHLPADPKVPLILIGPGTGIAPLRAFLQKRDELQKEGHVLGLCLLFFGCRHEDSDFLYESELKSYLENGVITNLYTAFSRDPPKDEKDGEILSMTSLQKIYVQHRMAQASAVIWQIIISKGVIFLAGDAKNMAKDVNKTLIHIIADRGNRSIEDAEKFLQKMKSNGRYNIDVWS